MNPDAIANCTTFAFWRKTNKHVRRDRITTMHLAVSFPSIIFSQPQSPFWFSRQLIILMAVFAAAANNQEASGQVNSDFDSATYLQPVSPFNHLVKRQLRPPNRRRPCYNGFPFGHRTIGSGNLLQCFILPELENQARNMLLKMLPIL